MELSWKPSDWIVPFNIKTPVNIKIMPVKIWKCLENLAKFLDTIVNLPITNPTIKKGRPRPME